jgi:6-bladed beta-propeller
VLEYSAEGHRIRQWGKAGNGPGEFRLPYAVQISAEGIIYVADRENGRIEEFDLTGKYLGQVPNLGRIYSLRLDGNFLWSTLSASYMRHRARDLARHTQIRIASDYAILVMGSLFMAWCSWRYLLHRPVMVAGITLTVLASAYVAFRKHRLAPAAHVPEDAGALDSLSFYRRELERQRNARRGNWRWWLPPMLPGLITVLASFLVELNPIPWAFVAVEAMVIVGGLFLGVARAEWAARRLQREIDALDSLVMKDEAR